MSNVLVFGARGTLGKAIVNIFEEEGWNVSLASRHQEDGYISLSVENWFESNELPENFDAVIWSQGINMSGSILDSTDQDIEDAFSANVLFIIDTLRKLYLSGKLARPSRGVVISSIWQEFARANKLAYVMSKSALSGLIPTLAIDLADSYFSINSVLPGVIDTPMTRAQLTDEQIARIEKATPGNVLATAKSVANAAFFLATPQSAGINGQSIIVDNGWSIKREI